MAKQLDEVFGSQPFEATRIWKVDMSDLTLRSLTGEKWLPGEVKESHCSHIRISNAHQDLKVKPDENCTCGIWSCKTRKQLHHVFRDLAQVQLQRSFVAQVQLRKGIQPSFGYKKEVFVSARIEQWGVVIEHEMGYRSEYARIIPESIQYFPRGTHQHKKLVAYLREKYGATN